MLFILLVMSTVYCIFCLNHYVLICILKYDSNYLGAIIVLSYLTFVWATDYSTISICYKPFHHRHRVVKKCRRATSLFYLFVIFLILTLVSPKMQFMLSVSTHLSIYLALLCPEGRQKNLNYKVSETLSVHWHHPIMSVFWPIICPPWYSLFPTWMHFVKKVWLLCSTLTNHGAFFISIALYQNR